MRQLLTTLFVASLATSFAIANEPPPPPTSPTTAIPIGSFGYIPAGRTLFESYDSGVQAVGTQFFPSYWYRFSVGKGEAQDITFQESQSCGNATYTVYDGNLRRIGILGQVNLDPSQSSYFIQVTAGGQTNFRFRLFAFPAKNSFQNDAGQSENAPLALGTLVKVITHTNDFYTYFTRDDLLSCNQQPVGPGEVTPNFLSPDPAIQVEYYSFVLANAATVKVMSIGQQDDTFVIHQPANGFVAVLKNNQTIDLAAGTYNLIVYDKLTQVFPGGGVWTVIRNARVENFEHHTFELLVTEGGGAPPSPNPNVPEVSNFGAPPHPQCIIIGTQRIGC